MKLQSCKCLQLLDASLTLTCSKLCCFFKARHFWSSSCSGTSPSAWWYSSTFPILVDTVRSLEMISFTCFRIPVLFSRSSSWTWTTGYEWMNWSKSFHYSAFCWWEMCRAYSHLPAEDQAEPPQIFWLLEQAELYRVLQLPHTQPDCAIVTDGSTSTNETLTSHQGFVYLSRTFLNLWRLGSDLLSLCAQQQGWLTSVSQWLL